MSRMNIDPMVTRDEFGPLGHVILTDWADAGALVTLTLRNGVQLTGLVQKQQPADPQHPSRVVGLVREHAIGGLVVRHDALLSEVVAITAVAR